MRKIVLGADIGGSHITTTMIDLDRQEEIKGTWSRDRIDSKGSAFEIIESWACTLERSIQLGAIQPLNISIAMPGPMDYNRGICRIKSQDKYKALYGLNLKEMLAVRLNFSPSAIHFMNDAACFLQGEVFAGSLKGIDEAIGLTLGTGLGTAHFTNGKAVDADLWKMPFLKGIAEDYLSTRWFIKRFHELSGIVVKDVKDLIDNHRESHFFSQIFKEFSDNLANFLYKFIRKEMPFAAVIGGNISNAEAYFLQDTRRKLAELMGYSFPVKCSILGESAALMGAGSSYH